MFLIHGGPQGDWGDAWSYRWNPSLWAAQGWVVAAPNPRGSTGFGQKFVDEITQDWAGKVMIDLDAVFNTVAKLPYVDATRQGVAGASYGGYAVDWLITHTDRFKAAVSHDGVFNLESMALATEEGWFTQWEFGGLPWSGHGEGAVHEVLAAPLRREPEDADAGDHQRARFPRAGRSGAAALHRAAAARRAERGARVRGRGALGAEGAQQQAVAREGLRLDEQVPRRSSDVQLRFPFLQSPPEEPRVVRPRRTERPHPLRADAAGAALRDARPARRRPAGHDSARRIEGRGAALRRAAHGDWAERQRARVLAAKRPPAAEIGAEGARAAELPPQLLALAARHGLDVTRVTIRNQRSRWGSCSSRGHITLNFRLMLMPPEVREYILIHELMHLKQANHSIRFWRLVEAACPGFPRRGALAARSTDRRSSELEAGSWKPKLIWSSRDSARLSGRGARLTRRRW